jgi:glycosyltransferase involved in cell wall biosynthesis
MTNVSSVELGQLKTGIVIPAFQAESTLTQVLDPLLRLTSPDRIIVVDDGSTDGTLQLAESKQVMTVRHPINKGKGAALMTGLLWARSNGWEWAVTLDADGQHATDDLKKFLSVAPSPDTGVVVGTRSIVGTKMPLHRRISNSLSTWIVSKLAGTAVFDAQCGYRAYRICIIDVFPQEGRFEWEAQALILCCRNGHGVEQVPVQTLYSGEDSHIRLAHDTWRFLRMAGRLAWTR